ncbi:hypothetical protein B841_03870 [Corynebacterium maris DSM 45190]|uniref:Uncharacterized protein n=1 Tax=Corynebacterium maris DSM 45190 TaxID=1224163 RepID=S5ST65_9CORY|nr:hypothetical protein B841_03870 [Corynebacterium maris DSM 45190]
MSFNRQRCFSIQVFDPGDSFITVLVVDSLLLSLALAEDGFFPRLSAWPHLHALERILDCLSMLRGMDLTLIIVNIHVYPFCVDYTSY